MLKDMLKELLQKSVQEALTPICGEVLAYDMAKQCVTDEEVERCSQAMLEHISEERLVFLFTLFKSDLYQQYMHAMEVCLSLLENNVRNTVRLLTEAEGEA